MTVELRPAPPHSGIVFLRDDLGQPGIAGSAPRIAADVRQRIEVPRRTTLAAAGAQVEMVEHVLAALYGLGIDNCEVGATAPELPGLDGSCQPLMEAIASAGIVEQRAPRRRLVVTDVTRVGNDESWVEARPAKAGGLNITYKLDYGPNNPIGKQVIELSVTPQSFPQELASARTFIMEDEAQWLRERGLGTRVTSQDLLVFGPDGPIDNTLRFEDECVRHKALDLVGDLALAGCDLVGQFIAYKSGHRLNAELVRILLVEGRMEESLRRSA